jgi:jagged-like protein
LSPTSGPEENRAVTEGIRVLGEFISRKQTNLSALTSIVEVKVETALVSEEKQGKSTLYEHTGLFLTFWCKSLIVPIYFM